MLRLPDFQRVIEWTAICVKYAQMYFVLRFSQKLHCKKTDNCVNKKSAMHIIIRLVS